MDTKMIFRELFLDKRIKRMIIKYGKCPSVFGLKVLLHCDIKNCSDCWKKALE